MLLCCKLSPAGFAKWQIDTYQKIMSAYFELKAAYDEQVAAAQIRQDSIGDTNPDKNRFIERNELKKHVISMLAHQHFDEPPFDQEVIGDEPVQGSDTTYPEIKFDALKAERDFIHWFEQSFEWPQMTYVYYPYYWANKERWIDEVKLTDPDPQFEAFLKAGAARVVLPVRPGFERAMTLYLATGLIWNGAQVPQVDDPLYVSAIQEIKEQQNADKGGEPEGDPWEVRLPTTLVYLQESGGLNG